MPPAAAAPATDIQPLSAGIQAVVAALKGNGIDDAESVRGTLRRLLASPFHVVVDNQTGPVTLDLSPLVAAVNAASDEALVAKVEQVRALLSGTLTVHVDNPTPAADFTALLNAVLALNTPPTLALADGQTTVGLTLALGASQQDVPVSFRVPFTSGITDYKTALHVAGLTVGGPAVVLSEVTGSRTNAGTVVRITKPAGIALSLSVTVMVTAFRIA